MPLTWEQQEGVRNRTIIDNRPIDCTNSPDSKYLDSDQENFAPAQYTGELPLWERDEQMGVLVDIGEQHSL